MKRYRGSAVVRVRRTILGATAIVALLVSAVSAWGATQSSTVASYTGCLNTISGTIKLVAVGDAPLSPCPGGTIQIHFSGGTITSVNAGPGLTGGGSNGDVTLGVAPSYQLPQTCSSGQIPAFNGSGWGCGTINTYNGSNFALSNQACPVGSMVTAITGNGQVGCVAPLMVRVFGPGTKLCTALNITCANDATVEVACPTGTTLIGGTYFHDGSANDIVLVREDTGISFGLPADEWAVEVINNSIIDEVTVNAVAFCLAFA